MARRGARPGPWLLAPPLAALVLAVGWLWLDKDTGIQPWLALRADVGRDRARVAGLERERSDLLLRTRRLRSDSLAVEAVARERLGMVRPGELVIQWREGPGRD